MTLRHLNGQLSRRSVDIEFNRYLSDNSEHREAFINCLWTFQQHLPSSKTPELVNQWDYFYERSIGCVGVLKDCWTGALALARKMAPKPSPPAILSGERFSHSMRQDAV